MTSPLDPQPGNVIAPAVLADPNQGALRSAEGIAEVKLTGAKWWSQVGWRHVVGLLAIAFAVFPVLYIVSAAFNPAGTVVATGIIPSDFSLVHFQSLFNDSSRPFARWFGNTLLICTLVTFGQVFCSALGAYAFSRFRFRGRRGGLLALLLIQMFPQFLAVVALYLMFTQLG